ncbi:transposase [Planctomycetota bacterium]
MARLARAVIPGIPHHVTQRGNRRQAVFFKDTDYEDYIELLAEWGQHYGLEYWAYCLMPNHVHLIVVPSARESLARAIGETHRRYTRMINFREDWRGYLWQGRFGSFPMDEQYLYAAARYVEMNPVRARLVKQAQDYKWSSAHAHLKGEDDKLIKATPLLNMVDDWQAFLTQELSNSELSLLRKHERTGRPLGSKSFIKKLEALVGRIFHRRKPGPKRRN